MRRHFHFTLILAAASAIAFPATANAIEFLDRIVEFTEDALKQAQRNPDGPPPFRVGLMLPKSGALREAAERVARGWEIALAMSDGIVAERPVEIIIGDTSKGPEDTIRRAEAMSKVFPVDVFAGVIGARTASVLSSYTEQVEKPLVLAGAVGEKVMSGPCRAHVARTSFNIAPYQTTSGRFIAGKFKTLVTLGRNSKGGHRLIKRFTQAYRRAGGRLIEQAWATSGRKYDWSALLSRSALGGPQAIYAFFEGRNAERIVHQHSQSGIKRRTSLIGPEWLYGPRVMNRRGKHAAGTRFLSSYPPDLATPANRIFVDAYRAAFREDPDLYAYLGYENALAVLLTAAELDGQVGDGATFIAAMKKVAYAGLMPRGDFVLNDANSAFLTRFYWVEIVNTDDGARLKRLGSITMDPDKSVCKKQTAQIRN